MSEILLVCSVAVVAFVLSIALKNTHPSISLIIIITTSIIVLLYILDYIVDVVDYIVTFCLRNLFVTVCFCWSIIKILIKNRGACAHPVTLAASEILNLVVINVYLHVCTSTSTTCVDVNSVRISTEIRCLGRCKCKLIVDWTMCHRC